MDAYKMIHAYFPDARNFEGILQGAINSGQILMTSTAGGIQLSVPVKRTITPDTIVA